MSRADAKRWAFLQEFIDQQEQKQSANDGDSSTANSSTSSLDQASGNVLHRVLLEQLTPLPEHLMRSFVYAQDVYPYCGISLNDALDEGQSSGDATRSEPLKKRNGTWACDCKPDHSNPHCVNTIQEQYRWLDNSLEVLWDQFIQISLSPELVAAKSLKPRQDRIAPCGLRNLGATCYLNAFIQTWMMNKKFVNGVHAIQTMSAGESPVKQLQYLMAKMEYGVRPVQNPSQFVESLSLNVLEQQDANEFYRLFLSMLESMVAPERNFIRQLYQGDFAHTTQCLNCNHKSRRKEIMMQLELAIKDRITIEQALVNYLAKEKLEHPNQYLCPVCQSKQDALRYTELLALPSVLNLQLMRFVIDWDSDEENMAGFRKKKILSGVRIPMVLDMRQFLAEELCSSENENDYMYDLKSVIVHYGESAYSGHYVAHVQNYRDSKWYKCDDESVSPIDLNDRRYAFDWFTENHPTTPSTKRGKKKSAKKQKDDDSPNESDQDDGHVHYYSRNAYMLLYERRSQRPSDLIQPADDILQKVTLENDAFLKEVRAHEMKLTSIKEWFTKLYSERRHFLENWRLQNSQQNYVVLPRLWIQKWLSYPFDQVSQLSRDSTVVPEGLYKIDISPLLCSHGKWDPNRLELGKQVHSDILTLFQQPSYTFHPYPLLKGKDTCGICSDIECLKRIRRLMHPRDVSAVQKILHDEEMNCNSSRRIIAAFSSHQKKEDENKTDSEGKMWVSKSWLKEWMKKNPKFGTITEHDEDLNWFPNAGEYASDVICEHGGLQPDDSIRRLVPAGVWKYWLENIPGFQHALDKSNCINALLTDENESVRFAVQSELDTVCQSCVHATVAASAECGEKRKVSKEERALFKSFSYPLNVENVVNARLEDDAVNGRVFYLLSPTFVNCWRQFILNPDEFDRPNSIDNSDLLCDHGQLRFDINEYSEYGSISENSSLWPWSHCKTENADLYYYPPLPIHRPVKNTISEMTTIPFYIVTRNEWIHLKQRYGSPVGCEVSLTVEYLDLYDIQAQCPFQFVFLKPTLKSLDVPVGIKTNKTEKEHDTNPLDELKQHLCCSNCYARGRLEWNLCTIYVRLVNKDDPIEIISAQDSQRHSSRGMLYDPTLLLGQEQTQMTQKPHRNKKALVDSDDSADSGRKSKKSQKTKNPKRRKVEPISSYFGVATNMQRRSSTRVKQKSSFPVEIDINWNVRDLKVAIMEHCHISPIHQRLFVCGGELSENEIPLNSIHLMHNMIVDLLVTEDCKENGGGINCDLPIEKGFQGTALVRPHTDEAIQREIGNVD